MEVPAPAAGPRGIGPVALGAVRGCAASVRVPRHPGTADARRPVTAHQPDAPARVSRSLAGASGWYPPVAQLRDIAMNLRITLVLIALAVTGGVVWWVGPQLPRQLAPPPEQAPADAGTLAVFEKAFTPDDITSVEVRRG